MARGRRRPTNKFDVAETRILECFRTIRLVAGFVCGTASIGIIAWAAVKISDKPAWLTFALAVLTALSGPTIYLVVNHHKISRTIDQLRNLADASEGPDESSATVDDESPMRDESA
jgi:uncharacterized membrane protein